MADMIESVNGLVADATVFQFKMKQRHWNVRGHHFFTLHEQFEGLYTMWTEVIDTLAERTLSLGGRPLKSMDVIMKKSAVKETPDEADEIAMVRGTIEDLDIMRERMCDVISRAQDAEDRTTENLLDPYIDHIAKMKWMFAAYLGESV